MISKIVKQRFVVIFDNVNEKQLQLLEEFARAEGIKPTRNPRTPPIRENIKLPVPKKQSVAATNKKVVVKKTGK